MRTLASSNCEGGRCSLCTGGPVMVPVLLFEKRYAVHTNAGVYILTRHGIRNEDTPLIVRVATFILQSGSAVDPYQRHVDDGALLT